MIKTYHGKPYVVGTAAVIIRETLYTNYLIVSIQAESIESGCKVILESYNPCHKDTMMFEKFKHDAAKNVEKFNKEST